MTYTNNLIAFTAKISALQRQITSAIDEAETTEERIRLANLQHEVSALTNDISSVRIRLARILPLAKEIL